MSFRRRLLLLFSILVVISVAVVTAIVSVLARRSFDRINDERATALVAQFQHEFSRRGVEVAERVQATSSTPEAARMAVAAAQDSPNYSAFLDEAQTMAESQRLDFLEFCDDRGTIISSAQWPAKFGYSEPLLSSILPAAPFLKEEETPSGSLLGLFAIRGVAIGGHKLYAIGGVRLDQTFLSSLDLPSGMRLMLYENVDPAAQKFSASRLISADGPIEDGDAVAPLIAKVQRDPHDASMIVHWKSGSEEGMNAFPLLGEKNQLLGILLVGSSRAMYAELRAETRSAALLAAGAGLLLAVVLSSWAAARVTKPLENLAAAAQEIAAGNWQARVAVASQDEVGALAESFNRMSRELAEQQERLLQAERVAAWRELARRLAHELKNPLFPLQLTVENLLRAREAGDQFDEVFHESARTLLSEIANLRKIVERFSDFSKMPLPEFQPVKLNELTANVAMAHQAQLDRASITSRRELLASAPIAADPDLLFRAISNLISNAIDAMPQGGTLTVRTSQEKGSARIEVSDTGTGLTPEESSRLFTPYYTSKPHGTGLGLAIVQSIVSDHGGKIAVTSEPGRGTTFTIQLPANLEKLPAVQASQARHV